MQSASHSSVGVIGLGLLGTAIAERLLEAGIPTVVYNRTKSKSQHLIDRGAKWSSNPIVECDRTIISLYTTETVEATLEQLASGLESGKFLIDTTTGTPQQSAALGRRLAEAGVNYLESPIAASSAQTREGHAVAFVAGSLPAFDSCQDLYSVFAPKAFFVGEWGNAAMMKLVNNLVLGLTRAALAEGLVLAEASGLDPAKTLEILKQGNAYSTVMDVKGLKMIEKDFSAQGKLTQHLKDVRLIRDEGRRFNQELPITALHEQLLAEVEEAGLGELDNSAIIEALRSRVLPTS